jgi:hypothetical protein
MRSPTPSPIAGDRNRQPPDRVPWRVWFAVLLLLVALAGYVVLKGWILVRMLMGQ